jgi:hypothetical protein
VDPRATAGPQAVWQCAAPIPRPKHASYFRTRWGEQIGEEAPKHGVQKLRALAPPPPPVSWSVGVVERGPNGTSWRERLRGMMRLIWSCNSFNGGGSLGAPRGHPHKMQHPCHIMSLQEGRSSQTARCFLLWVLLGACLGAANCSPSGAGEKERLARHGKRQARASGNNQGKEIPSLKVRIRLHRPSRVW